MAAKAKAIAVVALLLMMVIITIACTPNKAPLPLLWKAPDFVLTNQDGQEVRLSDFRGKVVVLSFFYASCPDACLILNRNLATMWHELEEGVKQGVVLISVSFDPAVDTPEVLKQYAMEQKFDVPGWQFLTGTQQQIQQVTANYGLAYEPFGTAEAGTDLKDKGQQRTSIHSIVIVLIDGNGMVRKTYGNVSFPNTEMISDITSLF